MSRNPNSADRTQSSRKRAGSRRNKKHRNVESRMSDFALGDGYVIYDEIRDVVWNW